MNKQVTDWMKLNQNKILESPRKKYLEEILKILKLLELMNETSCEAGVPKKGTVLPLEFWRFEIALDYITSHNGEFVRLGTRFDSEDPERLNINSKKSKTTCN